MNVESVKRIVALQRQITAARAMMKRGDLTEAEGNVLIDQHAREVSRLRQQLDLPLDAGKKPK